MEHRMGCAEVERNDVIERYLAGRDLGSESAVWFEEHFFECEACLQKLQLASALRAASIASNRAMPQAAVLRRRSPLASRMAWAAALAAMLAVVIWIDRPRDVVAPPVSSNLAEWAHYQAPHYASTGERSPTPLEAAFEQAMARYSSADYAGASQALASIVERHPEQVAARFYHGASELLRSHPDAAIAEMAVVLASGDATFADEARWCRAKAWIAKADFVRAREELAWLAAGGGVYAAPAKRLLSVLLSG
jgi:hypothetical protein